ncbi:MAG: DUF4093 domain-containing protein [Clostridia bacterium]|nr:DUF4093 domain-containing protein [Clostridia bacterium]
MIKVDRAVIVEGRYDKIKLSSIIDGVIIETEGFGIFKDKEKQKLIRRLAEEKGLLILTDSDSAGFFIRSFISSIVNNKYIVNAYIPDILGKEKRKDSPSKEGKLGVEGVSKEVIESALRQAGVGCEEVPASEKRLVTKTDLFNDGLSGGAESSIRRKKFLKYLDLPERMTANAMLELINIFMTYDDYKNAVIKSAEEEI